MLYQYIQYHKLFVYYLSGIALKGFEIKSPDIRLPYEFAT